MSYRNRIHTPRVGRTFSLWILGLLLVVRSFPAQAQSFAYVANFFDEPGTIAVVNLETHQVVDRVAVPSHPQEVSITPDGAYIYVTHYDSRFLSIMDTATHTVNILTMKAASPSGVAFSPDGAFAYLLTGGAILVMDTKTQTEVDRIEVSGYGIAVTPDGAFAYLCHPPQDFVSVVDLASGTIIANIGVIDHVERLAITPDGALVYAVGVTGLWVIETATYAVVARIPSLSRPRDIAFAPDSAFAYVPSTDSTNPDTVTVISTRTQTVVTTIPAQYCPMRVAVAPDGASAYATTRCGNTVLIIDTETNRIVGEILVGGGPQGIAITP